MSPRHVPLFINGQKCDSSSGETFNTYHPGTKEHTGIVESASSADIREAIEAAQAAFPAWERVMAGEKRRILNKAADILESQEYIKKFSESVPQEVGSVSYGGGIEAHVAATQLREAAAQVAQIVGETFPSGRVPGATVIIQKRAYGVILAIAPWNSPVNLAARATAIPLVCGNAVILKSSEVCPRTHELYVDALHEAGLPKGVLNLIHISQEKNPERVREIIAHPLIKHVNFTGSDRVGRILAAEAGKHLKPCVMELGGKAAAVVLNDANIKMAARAIISGAMLSSGQICMSSERVIVQRGVSEALITELTTLAKKLKAGPNGTDSQISGVFNASAAERIIDMLREAENDGAKILVGDLKNDGPYVQPHVVLGYTKEMRAWKQETFGPVFGITICDTVDEAIDLANDTDFALTSSLWTTSLKGLEIASRIRTGSVMINGSTFHPEPSIEIHGVGGSSGWGRYDIDNFTQRRIIIVHPEEVKFPLVDDLNL
ncbi:Aldehyde/histidinol dehydrogenase [Hysterangium stoloniferum]|nr:Aldehyde/histidinol dehydrogenase [Hysterangium stoloniferum]